MLKQSLKFWNLWIIEPYSWLILTFFSPGDVTDSLPEKMDRGEYLTRIGRLILPFFTIAYPIAIVALPIFAIWYGDKIPSPFPFYKLAVVCAICELVVLAAGSFGRTKLTFLLTIGIGLPVVVGLAAAIATF